MPHVSLGLGRGRGAGGPGTSALHSGLKLCISSPRASSPIWASEASLAKTREARFACPNRRACSQASFKPYQTDHDSAKEAGEKGKTNVDPKIPMKILFHYTFHCKILRALPQTFPIEMKPTKWPSSKRKRSRQEKRKKRGGEKTKIKPWEFAFCASPNLRS